MGKYGYQHLRLRRGACGLHERTSLSSVHPSELLARSQRSNWGSMGEEVWSPVLSAGVEEEMVPVERSELGVRMIDDA